MEVSGLLLFQGYMQEGSTLGRVEPWLDVILVICPKIGRSL